MFEKNMKISYLLDIYGSLLDEHIAGVMKSYYDDDLSLAEIASEEGISRQGVRHLIKKGEIEPERCEEYECDYCTETRIITEPIDSNLLGMQRKL